MSNLKQKIIDDIIRVEGGYVNDPSDSGGETNFGITVDTARAYGYTGLMAALPRETAFDIYVARYWDAVRGEDLIALSESITAEIVDTAVNMGPKRAGKFLQRSLNAFNNGQRAYNDIATDGIIGPGTVFALTRYLQTRDEATLVKVLNCLQGAFYIDLVERREKDEKFINGWFKNRVT